jgi:hypothetical protein
LQLPFSTSFAATASSTWEKTFAPAEWLKSGARIIFVFLGTNELALEGGRGYKNRKIFRGLLGECFFINFLNFDLRTLLRELLEML